MNFSKLKLVTGGFILGALILLALVGPFLMSKASLDQNLSLEFAPPSSEALLGRGENGVSMLAQLIFGARLSLGVAFIAVFISVVFGMTVGALAPLYSRLADDLLMRTIEIFSAFPGLLLVMGLAFFLGPSLSNLILAMSISGWVPFARISRALVLSLREREFVKYSESMGATKFRILQKDLIPNLLPILMVQLSHGLAGAILTESSLSFLGLGVPVGTPSWGQMLNQGRENMVSTPHVIWVPALALVLCIFSVNLIGDALRDFFDPRGRYST